MKGHVTVGAVTHTHTQDNLNNKLIRRKDMMYLCDFEVFEII